MLNLSTVKTPNIYAIIGRSEMKKLIKEASKTLFTEQNELNNVVWISFTDPNKSFLYNSILFKDSIKIRCWDVEEEFLSYKPISEEDILKLYNFIISYKDKKFIINCEAGQSRSSAVGLFIEYINRDMFMYKKWSHFPSKILAHERYSPNMYILNKLKEIYEKEEK